MPKILKGLSLCDGVASGLEALKRLKIKCEYHAIESEQFKRDIADENHKGIKRPSNDVYEFSARLKTETIDHYDFIFCGFTCTSLSSQGNRDEWKGESKIFFDCLEIVKAAKEVNPNVLIFFENVHSMSIACRDEISRRLECEPFLGNAGLVSVQERMRYYWFNWAHPFIPNKVIDPASVLDEDGLVIVAFSKSNRNKKGEPAIVKGRIKTNGKAGTLVTGVGCKGQSTMNVVFTKKMKVRDLTTNECIRLQGLANYKWPCTKEQIHTSIGEGWQLDMIVAIFEQSPLMRWKGK